MKQIRTRILIATCTLAVIALVVVCSNRKTSKEPPLTLELKGNNASSVVHANNGSVASVDDRSPTTHAHAQKSRAPVVLQMEKTFGAALETLHLSPDQLVRVKALLVDRLVSEQDAHTIAVEKGMRTVGELKAVRAQADAENDSALKLALPDNKYSQLSYLVGLRQQLELVGYVYDPGMSAAGVPLSGEQAVRLAEVQKEYIDDVSAKLADATAQRQYRAADIDPAGLSSTDRKVLGALTGVLNDQQTHVLREILAKTTARFASYLNPQST